jgi:hypothetical protein
METAKRRPRHFPYLDHEVAGSYLSHFIGGLPEGGSHTDRQGDDAGLGFKAGVPGFGVNGRLGDNSTSEDMENYRHVPASVFDRLYRQLDEHKMLIKPRSLDEEGWKNLQRGDFLEISGTLKIPEIVKMLGVAREFDKLLPFIEQLGAAGEIGLSQDDREILGLIRMFGELGNPESSPDYHFVTTLKRKFLEGNLAELEGEITILGKIQRKINEGDPPIGIEQLVPGLEGLRGLTGLSSHEPQQATDDDLSIGHPACTLIPIGIYL